MEMDPKDTQIRRLEDMVANLSDKLAESVPARTTSGFSSNWATSLLMLLGWLASLAFIWGTTTQRIDGIASTLMEIRTSVSDFPIVKDHQRQTEDKVSQLQKDLTSLTGTVNSMALVIDGLGLKRTSPRP